MLNVKVKPSLQCSGMTKLSLKLLLWTVVLCLTDLCHHPGEGSPAPVCRYFVSFVVMLSFGKVNCECYPPELRFSHLSAVSAASTHISSPTE